MTTGHELPVVGIGPSAISCLDDMYAQNEVQFPAWARRVQHELAIVKHHKLSRDDIMARWTINQLYSYRRIDKKEFERKFNINFDVFYADAQSDIMGMEQAGLIDSAPSEIKLRRGLGWLLLRAVAAAFDRYLKPGTWQQGLESRGGSRVG